MENNNSEKTGRLTPGQIDAVVRISGEIRKINRLFELYRDKKSFLLNVSIGIGSERVFVETQKSFSLCKKEDTFSYTMVDDEFFSMVKDYFTEKRSRLESELAEVISGEGGER